MPKLGNDEYHPGDRLRYRHSLYEHNPAIWEYIGSDTYVLRSYGYMSEYGKRCGAWELARMGDPEYWEFDDEFAYEVRKIRREHARTKSR